MTRLVTAILSLLSFMLVADEKGKSPKQTKAPLSESFLLFLAQMEKVDGEWVHAVDVPELDKKALTKDVKTMNTKDKTGDSDDQK